LPRHGIAVARLLQLLDVRQRVTPASQILRASAGCAMQISHPRDGCSVRAGDLVLARRARWRVVDVRSYGACQLVTLTGVSPPIAGVQRRLLTPFDTLTRIERTSAVRMVGRTRWRRAFRALVARQHPPGGLRTAADARIDLLPYQLEPALALLRGAGVRLLLADDVGLGKTIQAGLTVAELIARGAADRVLIVTPAGVREQWADELAERFAIDAVVVDGRLLRQRLAVLPVGVNPWSTIAVAIASVDYLKRVEVLPGIAACSWDVVVVDEAHGVAVDSDRRRAVHALASRATYVLLLTATPHNGNRQAFEALCTVGALANDDTQPLVVFRRTRLDVGLAAARRIHTVGVAGSADEQRMHAVLTQYSAAVRAERVEGRQAEACLALSVLHKRAFSSASSLARSVERRLSALSLPAEIDVEQLALPLGDPHGDFVAADEPPPWPPGLRLSDPRRERKLLEALRSAALAASRRESKIASLCRLLRRAKQSAVVFTEYRDTLMHVRAGLAGALRTAPLILHGGLAREERTAVLAEFSRSPGTVLLATDAAAEGLNLHRHCRLVVNLELPWNPMRLEQRIGRVDRIGQRRTVHAFHLIARDAGEARILSRLRVRIAAARADINTPDPLGDDERSIARLVVSGDSHDDDDDGESQD
jgi:superfamily II DNA or RNA helicase